MAFSGPGEPSKGTPDRGPALSLSRGNRCQEEDGQDPHRPNLITRGVAHSEADVAIAALRGSLVSSIDSVIANIGSALFADGSAPWEP